MLEPVSIRTYQPADAEAVRQLFTRGQMDFAAGLEASVEAYIRRSLAADLADITSHYLSDPGSHFWVADVDGEVKGMVGVQRRDEEEAELRRMSVAADTRRKRYWLEAVGDGRGLLPGAGLPAHQFVHGHPTSARYRHVPKVWLRAS